MTRGSHLFPSRTQKLSLSVPMVLGWTRPGRVGRCRILLFLSSSMAEHPAVNRVVVGSSPTWGANHHPCLYKAWVIFHFMAGSWHAAVGINPPVDPCVNDIATAFTSEVRILWCQRAHPVRRLTGACSTKECTIRPRAILPSRWRGAAWAVSMV